MINRRKFIAGLSGGSILLLSGCVTDGPQRFTTKPALYKESAVQQSNYQLENTQKQEFENKIPNTDQKVIAETYIGQYSYIGDLPQQAFIATTPSVSFNGIEFNPLVNMDAKTIINELASQSESDAIKEENITRINVIDFNTTVDKSKLEVFEVIVEDTRAGDIVYHVFVGTFEAEDAVIVTGGMVIHSVSSDQVNITAEMYQQNKNELLNMMSEIDYPVDWDSVTNN